MSAKPENTSTLPDIWLKSILKKQSDQERKRISVLRQVEEALNILEKKYQWDETYLFGSIALKGRFGQNSDVDIAVSGLKKFDYYEFVGEISDILNRRVDVVLLEECPLAALIKDKGLKWNRKSRS